MMQETQGDQTRKVETGRTVQAHLEVRFEDGFLAFSSLDQEPLRFSIGDGSLSPGLESLLLGLPDGSDTLLIAHGSDLFGAHDPSNLHWLEESDFPDGLDPIPGQVVSFQTPSGQETGGIIRERSGGRVQVDFNHPLSGRSLRIRVLVMSIC